MIKLKNVSKVYNSNSHPFKCLNNISLNFGDHEFAVIHGPSGSGKTSLLNIIGLLDTATEGSYVLDGVDVSGRKSSVLADLRLHKIGFIFQAYNLMRVLTVIENTEMILELQGCHKAARREKSLEVLDVLGLLDLKDRYPSQLSGGQQQRVAVARAIASSPKLIIADEPTANLDSKTANILLDYMQKLHEERGISFIFSSHEPLVISRARRAIQLKDGSVFGDDVGGKEQSVERRQVNSCV